MDIHQLIWSLSRISSSINEERITAEKYLKWAESVPGFSLTLFQVLTKSDEEIPAHTKHAASVIFKQTIVREWDETGGDDHVIRITPQERKYIKENIALLTVKSSVLQRDQLGVCIRKIGDRDYPEEWPEILPQIMSFITSEQRDLLIPGALYILRNLCKIYHYRTPESGRRDSINQIVDATFQFLFVIFTNLVNLNTTSAAEMLVLICKIFVSVTQHGLPPKLMDTNALVPWMTAFLTLLMKQVPLEQQPTDPELIAKWPWWKAKKWVGKLLTELFNRYSSKFFEEDEKSTVFGPQFMAVFSSQLTLNFLNLLVRDYKIMPDHTNHVCINFLNATIRISSTYKLLQPHLNSFLTEIIFPLLCFSAADEECWREDPHEFLRKEFELIEDYNNAKRTATSFIVDLFNVRAKANLNPFMAFLIGVLNRYLSAPPHEKSPQQKDGALLAIGSIANKLMRLSEYKKSLDDMLAVHVFPEFQSPHGYLRAKACWVFSQFSVVEFKNPGIFNSSVEMVLRLMRDSELPVRVQAALTVRCLMLLDTVEEKIEKILPQILEEFFNIMNEIDNDDLVAALEMIIDKYQEHIPPFAVNLCDRLAQAFLRVAADEDDDTSSLTALEYIKTIHTVLLSISKMPHIFPQIEVVLYPMLIQTLKSEYLDYFEEIVRTMTFITYYAPTISPSMWTLFPMIYDAFNEYATDFMSNILVVLDNYISRGTEQFLAPGTNYLEMVFNMYKKLMEDDQLSSVDAGEACKLIEVVFHHCRGSPRVDVLVQPLIELAVRRIPSSDKKVFTVLLLEVVANALYYNPVLALNALEQTGSTPLVFTTWFNRVFTDFKRCHDMKVSILGLSSIYLVPFESLPPTIKGGFSQIFSGIMKLIVKVSQQRAEEEKKKEAESEEEEEEENLEEIGDEEDVKDEEETLQSLVDKVREFEPTDFDELVDDEDEEYSSSIDLVHEHLFFIEAFQAAAQREAAVYQQLLGSVSDEDKGLFHVLLDQAPHVRAKHEVNVAKLKPHTD